MEKLPRFIDVSKCTSCGECAEVCPVELPDEYNQGMSLKKATSKKYAQTVPSAYAIEKLEQKPPCRLTCPAGINVQGYVQMVKQGKYKEALEIIMEELPLPGVLGRVCPAGCENACRRKEIDSPLAIRALKRLAADKFDPREIEIECAPERKEKVAIIGSGPAGLSCAYHLARRGIKSTIFEALPEPGGMLRVGIPEHRLPREVLDREIEVITNLGVEIKTNQRLGRDFQLDDLFKQGYSSVFVAIGAHKGIELGIPGEKADGVRQGVDYLREVNLEGKSKTGKKVAVIGGGNVAIDVARAAIRLGAEEVTIVYRRTEKEMPALDSEVRAAKEEGVKFIFLAAPQEVLHEEGKVVGLRCIRMELGEPDSSGRRRPIPIPDSEFDMEVDQVIAAIGQRPDISPLEEIEGLEFTRWSTIETNSISYATNKKGVFAGGDCQSGPWVVIGAVAAGKEVAISIERYLNGEDLTAGREPKKIDEDFRYRPIPETESKKERAKERELPVEERRGNFREVELGLSEEEGRAEAARCINCSYCCECFQCVAACGAEAVTLETHKQTREEEELSVGAVILSPGFNPYDPKGLDTYGFGIFPNVVTSMQFERILSASGPTGGHLVRPSDGKEPKKIAWLQCVGSRDINRCEHGYCSSVCCMYAIKEAVIAKEHAGADLECSIFYMDMRTYGKDFEKYYEQAKEKHGVRFIRSRIHTINPVRGSGDLKVRYFDEKGEIKEEQFDMVVLSVGLETAKETIELASIMGLELTEGKFCKTSSFKPVSTSKEGIYVCGAFQGPKDIPQAVVDSSAAAAAAGEILSDVRFTQTTEVETPPEKNIVGEPPRIGVFVCRCGSNIAGVIDVDAVRDYAATLPNVVHVEDSMYSCSQDTQDKMTEVIKERGLTRVIVAACTPKTHEPLFQETLIKAGLNKYMFEMVNIRNQDSWVHRYNPDVATEKAKELIRMAVNKVIYKEPLREIELNIDQRALVVGGGIAGLSAAINLAKQGYETHVVERTDKLGGNALKLYRTWTGESVKQGLSNLIEEANSLENLHIHLNSQIVDVDGFVGNFKTTIKNGAGEKTIEHGVTVIATGGAEYQPTEYLYGQDDRVKTHLELDRMFLEDDPALQDIKSAVFIQCVGSREKERPYCSRVCCTHSMESALEIKKRNPDAKVFILYRDIRTYGEREYLYEKARKAGVIFIRYDVEEKPVVKKVGENLVVEVKDHITGLPLEIETDLIALATAIVPYKDEKLAQFFKLPLNEDGFFIEKHAKLGPSEFAMDGIYLCGLAHYPKSIDESIAQGLAASSRAVTLLAKKKIYSSGEVSVVDIRKCVGCGVCVTVCPYSAPRIVEEEGPNQGKAEINPALCKGCGLCMASCRSGAISLKGMDNKHVFAMIEAIAV